MPLRSVEAATRDDAIAAAREQFGPSARVVGVRRVRSGGVLGFFATERYVAEVAPDLTNKPAVPAVTPAGEDDIPADFSSPLASAAPARARAAAPARNGAAAWAAEAARSTPSTASSSFPSSSFPAAARSAAPTTRSSVPSWQPAPAHPAAVTPTSRPAPAEDDRVSELASLLAVKQAETDTPTYARSTFPRAAFPRTGAPDEVAPGPAGRDADKRVIPADLPDAPSPFTAALARMVAGDREVRQAVEEALVRPGTARPGAAAEPRPTRPAESSVPSPAARQEEETVGDQVIAPSSSTTATVGVPTWAAEPEVAAPSVSPREEEIAEVLRSALAQGHSDEALAGILRKVLAGASPQTALTAPDAEPAVTTPPQVVLADNVLQDLAASPAPPALAEVVEPETVVAEVAVPEIPATEIVDEEFSAPVVAESAHETPVYDVPVFETPAFTTPTFEVPVFQTPASADRPLESAFTFAPVAPAPAWVAPAASMWGPPSASATLWGEPTMPAVTTSTPIWDEVESQEPVTEASVDAPLFDELVEADVVTAVEVEVVPEAVADVQVAPEVETLVDEEPTEAVVEEAAEAVVEEPTEAVAETVVEESVEESVPEEPAEAVAEELAPLMARTASDPAPMMSFDSTTVMPPLSLLPPLPGSRGRGRPPVPPAPNRRAVTPPSAPSVRPPAETASEAAVAPAETAVPVVDDVWTPAVTPAVAPFSRSLATVTRLPVAPLLAGPELAENLFEPAEAVAVETEPAVAEPVAAEPIAAAPASAAPIATGEVADRLVELGVPRSLLGPTFADDIAERGTYSALTRALALRLPKAPELPNGAGEVLFVVGPGVETLRAAQTLAASLRLDPDRVQWATRGDLAGLAPQDSRVTTVGAALDRRQDADVAGTVTIVAVDAPMRADAYWTAQMMAIWTPVAVWAVVEATRKPEDLEPWLDALPQVDALIVQDTDLSADPAAVLRRVDAPVALIDGARATPHRWASLLCERLENPQT